jgi:hypothetical protein
MKKLLLTLASLALFSTSLYAGCTADVDMGNTNKIINLEAGSSSGDAVNYAQTLKYETKAVTYTAVSADWDITVMSSVRKGDIMCLQMNFKNVSGADKAAAHHHILSSLSIKPLINLRINGTDQVAPQKPIGGYLSTSGMLGIYVTRAIPNQKDLDFGFCYPSNNL